MSKDTYLRIPFFDNRVESKTYKGWIKIESYSFQGSNLVSGGGGMGVGTGGRPAGKPFDSVTITKRFDEASPELLYLHTSGRHVDDAVLFFEGHPPGSPMAIFLMQNVLVGSMYSGGAHGAEDWPIDSFSLNFVKMDFMSLAQYSVLRGAQALVGLLSWFR